MTQIHLNAQAIAESFFEGFEARSAEAVGAVLSDDANIVIRFHIDGSPKPWYAFEGKEQCLAYIAAVGAKFDRVAFIDREWTMSLDGKSVFLQCQGDILSTAEQLIYRNVYIWKLEISEGKIHQVTEYANPVTYANLGIKNSDAESTAQS